MAGKSVSHKLGRWDPGSFSSFLSISEAFTVPPHPQLLLGCWPCVTREAMRCRNGPHVVIDPDAMCCAPGPRVRAEAEIGGGPGFLVPSDIGWVPATVVSCTVLSSGAGHLGAAPVAFVPCLLASPSPSVFCRLIVNKHRMSSSSCLLIAKSVRRAAQSSVAAGQRETELATSSPALLGSKPALPFASTSGDAEDRR